MEIVHFGANVTCIRKISRMPKSEGERSLFQFESATGYNIAAYLLPTFGFVEYSIEHHI